MSTVRNSKLSSQIGDDRFLHVVSVCIKCSSGKFLWNVGFSFQLVFGSNKRPLKLKPDIPDRVDCVNSFGPSVSRQRTGPRWSPRLFIANLRFRSRRSHHVNTTGALDSQLSCVLWYTLLNEGYFDQAVSCSRHCLPSYQLMISIGIYRSDSYHPFAKKKLLAYLCAHCSYQLLL